MVVRSPAIAIALVTFATFVDLLAYSVAVPILPDLARKLGVSPTTIGFLFASFGLTLLLFSVPMGAVSDRMGRRTPMIVGLVGLTVSTAIMAFADRLSWLFAARLVQGAADAITWVVGFALIADLYGPNERGRVMGIVMAGSNFGFMIGPLLGGWLYEAGGTQLPFLIVAALSALGVVGFVWLPLPSERVPREAGATLKVLAAPAVLACALVVAAAASTIAMLEPVVSLWLASDLGVNPARIGTLFGVAAVFSTALHPVYGRFADRWGGRRVTLVGLMATAVMMPLVGSARDFQSVMVAYIVAAAAFSLIVTPSLAYMAEATSTVGVGSYGVAYGIYNFAWGLGLLVGPAVGGFLFERIGFPRLTMAWMPLLLVVTLVLARSRRVQVPATA
jgi:DHA1 family solute carrier family 18 vesicular amine transporter 1/2